MKKVPKVPYKEGDCHASPSAGVAMTAKKRHLTQFDGRRGFTFIEIVLVAVILAVVGLALYGTFANGINIWKRVIQRPVTEDINVFFKNISYDLRNSFKITGIKFRGEQNRIAFPTRIKYHDQGAVEDSPGEVNYSFDRKKGALYKTQANYSEVFRKKPGRRMALAEGIGSLQFRYFVYNSEEKKYSWVTSWQAQDDPFGEKVEDNLPLVVRIEVGIPDGRSERKFVKTVPVPSACCWPLLEE